MTSTSASLLTSFLIVNKVNGHLIYQYTPKIYTDIIPIYSTLTNITPLFQSFVQLGRELHKGTMSTTGGTSSSIKTTVSLNTKVPELVSFQRVRFNYEGILSNDQYTILQNLVNQQSLRYVSSSSSSTTSSTTIPSTTSSSSSPSSLFHPSVHSNGPLVMEALYLYPRTNVNETIRSSDTPYYIIGLTMHLPLNFISSSALFDFVTHNTLYIQEQLMKLWTIYYHNSYDIVRDDGSGTEKDIVAQDNGQQEPERLEEEFERIFHAGG